MNENMYSFADNVRVAYTPNSFTSTGGSLKIMTLKEAIMKSETISKNKAKNQSGMFVFYIQDQLGVDLQDDCYSEGIVGVDIDHISKEEAKVIFDNFDMFCSKLGCIIACVYSHSYYNPEKSYGGLHFVMKTEHEKLYHRGVPSYRKNEIVYGALLCQLIYKTLGIDLRPANDRGIDKCMKSLGQRFYLNYSEVKWNSMAGYFNIPESKVNELEEWFDGYNWFENENSDYVITDYTFNSIDITTWNGSKINLGHHRRITILNALNTWGVPHQDRVNLLLNICGEEDYAGGADVLRDALIQTSRVADRKKSDLEHLEIAKKLLEKVGINVDAVFQKKYSDDAYEKRMCKAEALSIVYPFDDLLIDAMVEVEKRIAERQIVLNLKEDEFISDYMGVIKEKIFKHKATYIAADPGVGKTTLAERLTTDEGYEPMFGSDFFITLSGDDLSIDICVPYNSIVDSKALNNKALKRVLTADVSSYNKDGIKIFVWNTLKPIFDKYFQSGYKRAVFFFDESHKIVTDTYRWKVIIEMFKILPQMYSHFVFMTGTPAYEHLFLKEHFDDICYIKINKENMFNHHCTFLNYKEFGVGDMTELIRTHLIKGHLPMIYSNRRRHDWTLSVVPINEERIARGEQPLNVLYFNRDNEEDTKKAAKLKSIKPYDLVIATAYLNVGVDIYKDDDRKRVAIIDYANDTNSGYNEIWQFQGRNRQQDSYFEVICRTGEKYDKKRCAYGFNYYLSIAKIHAHDVQVDITDDETYKFLNTLYKKKKFRGIEKEFTNYKNVVLLACYYMYLDKFTYIHNIKAILKNKGCKITEIDMDEHVKSSIDDTVRKEAFRFFVENIEEINKMQITDDTRHRGIVRQIDLNTNDKEHIKDGKYIMSRDKRYMDWLYYNFGNNSDWIVILRKCLEDGEILTKGTFGTYNKLKMIADNITDGELRNIKYAIKMDKEFEDEEDKDSIINDCVEKIIKKHFKGAYSGKDIHTAVVLHEIVTAYKEILTFIAENKEVIEIIKKHRNENTMTAALKMKIIKDQRDAEKLRKKKSDAGKKSTKKISVIDLRDGKQYDFDSYDDAAKHFNVTKSTFSKFAKFQSGSLKKVALIVAS